MNCKLSVKYSLSLLTYHSLFFLYTKISFNPTIHYFSCIRRSIYPIHQRLQFPLGNITYLIVLTRTFTSPFPNFLPAFPINGVMTSRARGHLACRVYKDEAAPGYHIAPIPPSSQSQDNHER